MRVRILALFILTLPSFAGAITRRSFVTGVAASFGLGPAKLVSREVAAEPGFAELFELDPEIFGVRAMLAVVRRSRYAAVGGELERSMVVHDALARLFYQPSTKEYVRCAYPHLRVDHVDRLAIRLNDHFLDQRAKLIRLDASPRSWSTDDDAGGPDDTLGEAEDAAHACARRLQLPDVLRDWTWGPNFGRPLTPTPSPPAQIQSQTSDPAGERRLIER